MEELICSNVRTLKKGGSLLFCGSCGRIIGHLNPECYDALLLTYACKCGASGALRYNYTPRSGSAQSPLISRDGLFRCNECGEPLFSLKTSELKYFAASLTCKCGKEYTHLKNIQR